MGWHLIGFLATNFIGMTLVNRIMEGAFITASDITYLQTLTIFRTIDVFGFFTVPVPNLSFFTEGIPHLIKWDYSFFGGNAGIFQYFLYAVTGAVAFLLFTLVIGLLYQYFSRTR